MAKQTSSKSSTGTAKKKRTSDAPAEGPAAEARAPITDTLLKADGVTISKDVIVKSEPTHEQIAQRAFELYQRQSGGALNDWLSAERELRS